MRIMSVSSLRATRILVPYAYDPPRSSVGDGLVAQMALARTKEGQSNQAIRWVLAEYRQFICNGKLLTSHCRPHVQGHLCIQDTVMIARTDAGMFRALDVSTFSGAGIVLVDY